MKDVKWLTHNCTVGFLVAGVWNNRYYASTSSIMTTSNRATAQDMLISGDADGYLRLFRYVMMMCKIDCIDVESLSSLLFIQISMHQSTSGVL